MKKFKTKTNVELSLIEGPKYVLYRNYKLVNEKQLTKRDLTLAEFIACRNKGIKAEPNRMTFLQEEDIQSALVVGKISISNHTITRMVDRGYTKGDLVNCIWTGKRTEIQYHRGKIKAVIEGFDKDNNPICMIVGCKQFIRQTDTKLEVFDNAALLNENYLVDNGLTIISVFPPTKDKFIRNVLAC